MGVHGKEVGEEEEDVIVVWFEFPFGAPSCGPTISSGSSENRKLKREKEGEEGCLRKSL